MVLEGNGGIPPDVAAAYVLARVATAFALYAKGGPGIANFSKRLGEVGLNSLGIEVNAHKLVFWPCPPKLPVHAQQKLFPVMGDVENRLGDEVSAIVVPFLLVHPQFAIEICLHPRLPR